MKLDLSCKDWEKHRCAIRYCIVKNRKMNTQYELLGILTALSIGSRESLIHQNKILTTKLFQEQQKNSALEQKIFQLELRQDLVDVKSLKTENENLKKELDVLNKKNESLQKEIANLTDENEGLKEKVLTLEQKVASLTDENEGLKEKVLTLEQKVAGLTDENEGLKEKVLTLETKNDKLIQDISILDARMSQLETGYKMVVAGQLAFTFERAVNDKLGNNKKCTPFNTLLDQHKLPKDLESDLTKKVNTGDSICPYKYSKA